MGLKLMSGEHSVADQPEDPSKYPKMPDFFPAKFHNLYPHEIWRFFIRFRLNPERWPIFIRTNFVGPIGKNLASEDIGTLYLLILARCAVFIVLNQLTFRHSCDDRMEGYCPDCGRQLSFIPQGRMNYVRRQMNNNSYM